jgi:mono/diheme cytochrome c family protein
LASIKPRLRALILEGEGLWQRPPVQENTVACAVCHFDAAKIRGWAASFPKVKPMPPPFTRVMTLQQAVGEAATKHYRIPPGDQNRRVAAAIAAYLSWVGEGLPLTPGTAWDQPRFPDRLSALEASIGRGRDRVRGACTGCHRDATALAGAAPGFPRVAGGGEAVVTMEEFLERHAGLAWHGAEAAEVVAYLAAQAGGRPLRPGGSRDSR